MGDDSLSVSPVSLTFTSSDWEYPADGHGCRGDGRRPSERHRYDPALGQWRRGSTGCRAFVAATEIDDSGTLKAPLPDDSWAGCLVPARPSAFVYECRLVEGESAVYGMSLEQEPSGYVTIRIDLQSVSDGGDADITVSPLGPEPSLRVTGTLIRTSP